MQYYLVLGDSDSGFVVVVVDNLWGQAALRERRRAARWQLTAHEGQRATGHGRIGSTDMGAAAC